MLSQLMDRSREQARARERSYPMDELRALFRDLPPCRSLWRDLQERRGILAEVKRASPSEGFIAPELDAAHQGRVYEDHGACAISVLTETEHFGGSLEDLGGVRSMVSLPVLRKDFVSTFYQVMESRVHGADLILLIVAALETDELQRLFDYCGELGLEALVECHTERELEVAVGVGAKLIGVNSRDLKTLEVNLEVAARLVPQVPSSCVAIAESGISHPDQVRQLCRCGAKGFLVGSHLARSPHPERSLAELVGALEP